MTIREVPEHLVVVGGGVIGLEFASVYRALGSRVTVLEMMPTVLPGVMGRRLTKRLAIALHRRGIDIELQARVERIKSAEDGLRVVFENRGARRAWLCVPVARASPSRRWR